MSHVTIVEPWEERDPATVLHETEYSVSRAILPLYSKPRGSRSRHFSLTHELFFTVGNISIFLSTIILNTKSYMVLLDTGLKSPECCIEL